MVPWVLTWHAAQWSGRKVMWYIDNTSALYSVVKGSCKHPSVNRAIAITHLIMLHFDIAIWWEFVDSKANWSDGISREGADDTFAREHKFVTGCLPTPHHWWEGTLLDQWEAVQSCGGRSPYRAAVGAR